MLGDLSEERLAAMCEVPSVVMTEEPAGMSEEMYSILSGSWNMTSHDRTETEDDDDDEEDEVSSEDNTGVTKKHRQIPVDIASTPSLNKVMRKKKMEKKEHDSLSPSSPSEDMVEGQDVFLTNYYRMLRYNTNNTMADLHHSN